MSARRRLLFSAVLAICLALALLFLTLPVAAIFVEAGPRELLGGLRRPEARDALWVSLRSALLALALIVLIATPAAYLLATRRFRARSLLITLLELPIVLPPAVAGIALLAALGPGGLLGRPLASIGLTLPLSAAAVVIAMTFVAAPFYLRQALEGFAALDRRLFDAAETLGAPEWRWFLRVAVPASGPALFAGGALAFGRALGEFGATLMFAGSLRGVTQTVPLAIFETFSTDFDAALGMGALLVAISAALIVAINLAGDRPAARRHPTSARRR